MTISSSSSPARRDDDDGGVFSDRTESAREFIALPDLLKRGTKKENRESAAYEYCLGDADEESHAGWGRPSSVNEDRRSMRIDPTIVVHRSPNGPRHWGDWMC